MNSIGMFIIGGLAVGLAGAVAAITGGIIGEITLRFFKPNLRKELLAHHTLRSILR